MITTLFDDDSDEDDDDNGTSDGTSVAAGGRCKQLATKQYDDDMMTRSLYQNDNSKYR